MYQIALLVLLSISMVDAGTLTVGVTSFFSKQAPIMAGWSFEYANVTYTGAPIPYYPTLICPGVDCLGIFGGELLWIGYQNISASCMNGTQTLLTTGENRSFVDFVSGAPISYWATGYGTYTGLSIRTNGQTYATNTPCEFLGVIGDLPQAVVAAYTLPIVYTKPLDLGVSITKMNRFVLKPSVSTANRLFTDCRFGIQYAPGVGPPPGYPIILNNKWCWLGAQWNEVFQRITCPDDVYGAVVNDCRFKFIINGWAAVKERVFTTAAPTCPTAFAVGNVVNAQLPCTWLSTVPNMPQCTIASAIKFSYTNINNTFRVGDINNMPLLLNNEGALWTLCNTITSYAYNGVYFWDNATACSQRRGNGSQVTNFPGWWQGTWNYAANILVENVSAGTSPILYSEGPIIESITCATSNTYPWV
jgi:hypothetical protein